MQRIGKLPEVPVAAGYDRLCRRIFDRLDPEGAPRIRKSGTHG